MKNKKEIKEQIEVAVDSWNESKTVAEFFRKKLGTNGQADRIADNIIQKSLLEERPEWTKLLLDTMKVEQKESPTSVNLMFLANEKINDSLQKIIDVTPKKTKKGIEAII